LHDAQHHDLGQLRRAGVFDAPQAAAPSALVALPVVLMMGADPTGDSKRRTPGDPGRQPSAASARPGSGIVRVVSPHDARADQLPRQLLDVHPAARTLALVRTPSVLRAEVSAHVDAEATPSLSSRGVGEEAVPKAGVVLVPTRRAGTTLRADRACAQRLQSGRSTTRERALPARLCVERASRACARSASSPGVESVRVPPRCTSFTASRAARNREKRLPRPGELRAPSSRRGRPEAPVSATPAADGARRERAQLHNAIRH
jgi:hypothetical protein